MQPLPIDDVIPQIMEVVRQHRAAVVVAEPGAGKTTRVPVALLWAGLLSPANPKVMVLQPRRVAARTVAARIAQENGWRLGEEVGYQVRFERVMGSRTRLAVVTEGILNRQLLDDPYLDGIGAVILDEFHERSLHSDLAIALLREVRQTVRPDLVVMAMSATLDAEPVARYLGDCPILRAGGRAFAVQVDYCPFASGAALADAMAAQVEQVLEQPPAETGHILAFLPGAAEIRRCQRLLVSAANQTDILVLPLYGSLSAAEQSAAIEPSIRRKLILATNIAETSLTIDGVRTVVDAGFSRVASFDDERGMDRLDLQPISKASAAQRAGRAGRTAPGRCIRLWSEKQQHQLAEFDEPEIRRVDLSGTVLALHAWGKTDLQRFEWYERPDEQRLITAERLLTMLGALQGEAYAKLTTLGKRLAEMAMHPRLARLLVAAEAAGAAEAGATMAALLAEKDIALPHRGGTEDRSAKISGSSDLIHRMEMLADAERDRFSPRVADRGIDGFAAQQVARARDQLRRFMGSSTSSDISDETLLRLALHAYPDRVCKRREHDPSTGVMVGGGGVRLAAESTVRKGTFFVALDLRKDDRSINREALVRMASAVESAWLLEMFPQSIRRERGAEFDSQRQRVIGFKRVWYRDLLIEEDRDTVVNSAEAEEILAKELGPRATDIFKSDEAAANLLDRISLLRKFMPEHPWPKWDAVELAELLVELCRGRKSVADVKAAGLAEALRGRLVYPLDRMLEQHAPVSLQVPSGNRIVLQYTEGSAPVLAVRLQELFGWTATPTVAGGRVRVKLHLLGPNYRPVQVTDDLKNFWATTYFQVRKDLRARYPKHSWPEDPLTAKAEARGRRR